jgi:hypothetical protein
MSEAKSLPLSDVSETYLAPLYWKADDWRTHVA